MQVQVLRSNIKDTSIHKICAVRHAVPGRIPGGWRYFRRALLGALTVPARQDNCVFWPGAVK